MVRGEKCISQISTWSHYGGSFNLYRSIQWIKKGFIFICNNKITVFSNDGSILTDIEFKDSIYDAMVIDGSLTIVTKNSTYLYHIEL